MHRSIDFLWPSNISLTFPAIEPSSAMNLKGLKQVKTNTKTKYGRDCFTREFWSLASRFKFRALLWLILVKPLMRDTKLQWKLWRSIKELMFPWGCRPLGLFSLWLKAWLLWQVVYTSRSVCHFCFRPFIASDQNAIKWLNFGSFCYGSDGRRLIGNRVFCPVKAFSMSEKAWAFLYFVL